MPVPMARLNSFWRESGNIAVIEEEGILTNSEPFIHFPHRNTCFRYLGLV